MEFRILGPVEIWSAGRRVQIGAQQRRVVLAVLLAHLNRVVSVDRLIDGIWQGEPPPRARNAVQGHISQLRRLLAGCDDAAGVALRTEPPGYRLVADPALLDAHRFQRLCEAAWRADDVPAAARYAEAMRLWRGEPLADLPSGDDIRARLDDARLTAAEAYAAVRLRLGRHREVVADMRELTATQPLREEIVGHLVTALAGCGRQAEAIDTYHRTRRRLADELGLDPGPALTEAYHRVLHGTPTVPAQLPADVGAFTARDVVPAAGCFNRVRTESSSTMPFTVVSGQYRLVGRTRAGNPSGFSPDGDSIQFQPRDRRLLKRLPVLDRPVRFSSVGSVNLRMEGIDALELHFTQPGVSAHQPRPLADQGRDALLETLGLTPVEFRPPDHIRVRPPAPKDGEPGWILTRSLDVHGRPVSWLFTGEPPAADGAEVFLDDALLRRSSNHAQVAAGAAYPLFYDTLFADLRDVLGAAALAAEEAKRGLWGYDATLSGVDGGSVSALERDGVVFPKLFRRLVEYHATQRRDLAGFLPWLAALGEQVLDLDTMNFTHLDNVVEVSGDRVRMTRPPVRLVFVSDKGRRRPNRLPR